MRVWILNYIYGDEKTWQIIGVFTSESDAKSVKKSLKLKGDEDIDFNLTNFLIPEEFNEYIYILEVEYGDSQDGRTIFHIDNNLKKISEMKKLLINRFKYYITGISLNKLTSKIIDEFEIGKRSLPEEEELQKRKKIIEESSDSEMKEGEGMQLLDYLIDGNFYRNY